MHLKKVTKNFSCIRLRQGGSSWTIINIGGALFVKIPHKSVNFLPGVLPFGLEARPWLGTRPKIIVKVGEGDLVKITNARENKFVCGHFYVNVSLWKCV